MNRFFTSLLCIMPVILAGCLHAAKPPQAPAQTLKPIYKEKYYSTIKFVEYSDSGQTLVAAGNCRKNLDGYCINIYEETEHRKLVALNWENIRALYKQNDDYIWLAGAGHIDENTWFFAIKTTNGKVGLRGLVWV